MVLKWKQFWLSSAIVFWLSNLVIAVLGYQNLTYSEVSSNNYLMKIANFLWEPDRSLYHPIWPEMRFGWKIVVGSIIGFFGAAFGSVGGVGGGGIYVPMLTLIIGFDPKSSTAISKCMITGAAGSTVYYNLRLRHPTLSMSLIDYDLALLFQPMLMLGISIGVAFNVLFADWMVTILLITIFLVTSTKAFLRGVSTWKKETLAKELAVRRLAQTVNEEIEYRPLASGPTNSRQEEVSLFRNICWKGLALLLLVWVAFLALQIAKNHTSVCSISYWGLNLLQIPVAVAVTLHEAISLYKGRKMIQSKGDDGTNWRALQLLSYCLCGMLAGIVGGLLGLGGGFILGPLFLELGVPPQVSSATATFIMTFSASMTAVEYYLLNRFPVPYAIYFSIVAAIAALIGQQVVGKLIKILERTSLIIFILAFTIFGSAIFMGGIGIFNMIEKIEHHGYMGFANLCMHQN